ncbi:odorant receptor 46a-like [Athalia rosae]|uniref:odorant receptor 46a-like n=1 Tax=Athalia rosae TaxID=37344 RepID=UPI0020337126|nr:odorant receptor 46a-like [Athalia rosae]
MDSAERLTTKRRTTFERSMLILEYSTWPTGCWPLPADASASDIRGRNIWWWFSLFHSTISTGGWFWNIYLNTNNFDVAMKSISELCPLTAVFLKLVTLRLDATRLQVLLAEMDLFLKNATAEEWELVMRYYDKYFAPHFVIFVITVCTPLCYVFEPAVNSKQLFPGTVAYPFSVEPFWIWATLYTSHIVLSAQIGSMLLIDLMYSVLLWFTGARFELLAIEFSNANNENEFRRCVKKHQDLMESFVKLRITTGRMAVVVVSLAVFAVSTGGYILIRKPPVFEFGKYVFFEFLGLIQVFLFAWPSDHILEMGERMRHSVYNCAWVGKPPRMLKDMIIVLQRAKNPPIIFIEGFLPILSLEFFGNCVAASFSYIATLRAVAGD